MVKQMKKGFLNNHRKKQGTLPSKADKAKCSICFDVIERREIATLHDETDKRVCTHVYCNACIKKWSKKSNTCPLCRKTFCKIISKREVTKVGFNSNAIIKFEGILDLLMALMFRNRIRSSFFLHYASGHQQTRELWENILAPLTREFIKTYNDRHEVSFQDNEDHQSFYIVASMMGLPAETTTVAV